MHAILEPSVLCAGPCCHEVIRLPMSDADKNPTAGDPDWLVRASANVRRMYFYWKSKCQENRLPPRSALDPADIPDLLPYVSLVDVVNDERRYVYRLVGTYEVKVRGNDPTGRSVIDAFLGPSLENVLGCYDTVVKTRRPYYDDEKYALPGGRYVDDETLFLPFAEDGSTVNKILVFGATTDKMR